MKKLRGEINKKLFLLYGTGYTPVYLDIYEGRLYSVLANSQESFEGDTVEEALKGALKSVTDRIDVINSCELGYTKEKEVFDFNLLEKAKAPLDNGFEVSKGAYSFYKGDCCYFMKTCFEDELLFDENWEIFKEQVAKFFLDKNEGDD